jgi:enamine deaminase RidA (YjgF/YER057c/UK114 family)
MDAIERRLEALGLEVPPPPTPLARYVPAKKVGDLVFVSGQVPAIEGGFLFLGKVGDEITLEQARDCARQCALNALAAVKALVGSLEKVTGVVQVRGFVNCAHDFRRQPEVLDAASELLVDLFGEPGRHARAAVGTGFLPKNVPIELEMIVQVKE